MDFANHGPDDRLDLIHDPLDFSSADIGCWLTDPSFDLSPAGSVYPSPPEFFSPFPSGILHPSFGRTPDLSLARPLDPSFAGPFDPSLLGPFDLSLAYPLGPPLTVEIDSARVGFYFIFMTMKMVAVVLILLISIDKFPTTKSDPRTMGMVTYTDYRTGRTGTGPKPKLRATRTICTVPRSGPRTAGTTRTAAKTDKTTKPPKTCEVGRTEQSEGNPAPNIDALRTEAQTSPRPDGEA